MTARIRRKYADHIIYQSHFVKDWWEKVEGTIDTEYSIIPNAVDLNIFQPDLSSRPDKIICVEGTIDYSPFALETLDYLAKIFPSMSVEVYGSLEDESLKENYLGLNFKGSVERKDIHKVYNNGLYISLDINAACPNTVIESLACGIPVIGFDTGALKELIGNTGGVAVDFGSDPWKLKMPKLENLKSGIDVILKDYSFYSQAARKLALDKYSIEQLTEKYISILTQ